MELSWDSSSAQDTVQTDYRSTGTQTQTLYHYSSHAGPCNNTTHKENSDAPPAQAIPAKNRRAGTAAGSELWF